MDEALGEYVAQRLSKLQKIVLSLETRDELVCFVELARTTSHHRKGESLWYAEATLSVPGSKLRCEEKAPDIRKAIDQLAKTLGREVKKYKAIKVAKQ